MRTDVRMMVLWGKPPLAQDWYECEGCMKRYGLIHMEVPNYCPHCGGKVVTTHLRKGADE